VKKKSIKPENDVQEGDYKKNRVKSSDKNLAVNEVPKIHDIAENIEVDPVQERFRFIDLFAGIGGFHLAMHNVGGDCVFASEWDKYSRITYKENFKKISPELFKNDNFNSDIHDAVVEQIPDHDVLCAGFPCQPFSLAGVSKKNSMGRKHGFEDETQGTLFFNIKEILKIKRPKAFMLENVKNLLSHDNKQTFKVIMESLEDELEYIVNWHIVNGANWVPQHRERIYIVGYDPKQVDITDKNQIIIPEKPDSNFKYPKLADIIKENLSGYTLGPGTWSTLERHKAYHSSHGNGFGYGMHTFPLRDDEVTRTISARYHKDGAEILFEQIGERPRRLSVEEAMQLQGYDPKKFTFPVSNTQAYRQIGNSVVVPAIQATANEIAKVLKRNRN